MNHDPNNPVVLCDFLTELEATLVIGHLDEAGIQAMRSGTGGSTGWPDAASYTQVVVRERDFERAKKLLDEPPEVP